MKTKRVPIRLTEEQHKELERAAGSVGLNLASFIRGAALREAIEVNNATTPRLVVQPFPNKPLPRYLTGEW